MFPRKLQQTTTAATSSSPPDDASPSILTTVLVLAIAVILFASLYLLNRFLRRNRNNNDSLVRPSHSFSSASETSLPQALCLIDSLPVFTYNRLTSKTGGGDCPVCLSKFEDDDVLRLLPICCHAFHLECIDTWLNANLTCPLCRSPIFLSDKEALGKLTERSGSSFRVEIGNVSNRQHRGGETDNSGEIRRSYSLGSSFDYVISGEEDAVADNVFRRTSSMGHYKEEENTAEQQGVLAAEIGTRGGGRLKEYLSCSLSSSRTASFRDSVRSFFTGSSRRSEVELAANELGELEEASRLGLEISELFRWLSGA